MSVIVRQQLIAVAARLATDLTEAQNALSLPVQATSLQALGIASERITRSMNSMQNSLDKWTEVMTSMAETERQPEEKLFTDFKVGGVGPIVLLENARQAQTDVDIRIDQIKVAMAGNAPNLPQAPQPGDFLPSVRLPPLPLPEFDGSESKWGVSGPHLNLLSIRIRI